MKPEWSDITRKLDALSESLLIEREKQGVHEEVFSIPSELLQEIKTYLMFAAGVDDKLRDSQDAIKILNLGIKLMTEGYPSIDSEGLLPTSYIIADILSDYDYEYRTDSLTHLEEHLTTHQLLESDLMTSFAEIILASDEKIVYVEYGNMEFKRLVSKIKRNGIILTNRRILFVGCDIDTSRPSYGISTAKYVMVHPAIQLNISSPPRGSTDTHARIHYPEEPHRATLSSIDYLSLKHVKKIKIEKDGSLLVKASGDVEVRFSLTRAVLNRPFEPVQEYKSAYPECDIYVRLLRDNTVEGGIEGRTESLKSMIEKFQENI